MYHSERNPLRKVKREAEPVLTAKGARQRRLHKALLRYHDAENWPLIREALKRMGRADLIGNGKRHLVPSWQPAGTAGKPEGVRGAAKKVVKKRAGQRVAKHKKTRSETGLRKRKPAKRR